MGIVEDNLCDQNFTYRSVRDTYNHKTICLKFTSSNLEMGHVEDTLCKKDSTKDSSKYLSDECEEVNENYTICAGNKYVRENNVLDETQRQIKQIEKNISLDSEQSSTKSVSK
jgi:hypothetical protein